MATVVHRYEPSPLSVEKAAAKKAEAERRAEAARRKELARRTERRSANRGAAGLRREKTALERVKRLRLEMEVAAKRGELIERELVLRQASFLLTAMRSRCMSAPSAWARRLLNISDPREMVELLRAMMTQILEELADLPQRVTANPDWIDDGDAVPLAEVNGGQAEDHAGSGDNRLI